jgi:hypothetical protein
MARTTPETLLLSAVINSGDLTATSQYNITPDKMFGYSDEFRWVLDYYARWGHMPTDEHLKVAFPGFPLSDDEEDPRWPAQEVAEAWSTREALKALRQAGELFKQGKTGEAVKVMNSTSYLPGIRMPKSLVDDPSFIEEYEAPPAGRVTLPWQTPQMYTNGIGPGELWYLPARPMQGKSFFLLNIAANAACMGNNVMFVSLEMSPWECRVRYLTDMAHKLHIEVDSMAILKREFPAKQIRALEAEIKTATSGTLAIHDLTEGFASPSTIARYAKDYDLICIDYVGLMRGDNGSRSIDDWREAAKISNALKEISLQNKTRIIAATQINREGDNHHQWRPPKLRHLSQTDALAQDGDVVITLRAFGRKSRVLSLEKNRHGDSSRLFYTNFDPNIGDFTEITRAEADLLRDLYPLDED